MINLDTLRKDYLALLDINEKEQDKEEKIQKFLEEFPILLPLYNPYKNIIFRKLCLGNKECDFAFAREDSLGFKWHFIEIEKPWNSQFTKENIQHNEMTKGIQQILDWKSWFRDNRAYIQNTFPFKNKAFELGLDEPNFTLIIGRRKNVTDDNRKKLLEIKLNSRINIMSFDRLADSRTIFLNEENSSELKTCTIHKGKDKVISTMKLQ